MSSEISDEQVKKIVMDYLSTADMAVTTERTVLAHVQQVLTDAGTPVKTSKYKPVVAATIEEFLASLDEAEEEGDEGEEREEEQGGAAAGGSRKRRGEGEAAEGGAKRARGGGEADEDVVFSVDLDPKCRVKARVRRFRGRLSVDVREFYNRDGAPAPGPKGLSMDGAQWARLAAELPRLLAALRGRDAGGPAVELAEKRRAAVSEYRGSYTLGLREYWEKDGQLLPGKKGINLGLAEAEALLTAAPDIGGALGGVPDQPPPLPAPKAQKAAAAAGPGSGGGGAGAKGEGGGSGAGGADSEVVELGGNKRAGISRFGGRITVDLREFYESGGEMRPGKKGIALSPPDWTVLAGAAGEVTAALARRDMGYSLQLSGTRRVSLSEFKGTLYVNVREYYSKGGEMAPGAKGLSMNPGQWAACAAAAPSLTAALQRAQQKGG